MIVHNTGETPTFSRGSSQLFIDVTCSTSKIARKIVEWQVLDDESLSDHRLIYFEIKGGKTSTWKVERSKVENDWEAFRAIVEWKSENAEDTVEVCTQLLKEAFEDSQIQRGQGIKALVPYWWNHEIEEQRKKCIKARRMMTRANRNEVSAERREEKKEEYKVAKSDLRSLINSSKRKHWQELCEELDKDMWGDGYKIVTGKLTNRRPIELTTERKRQIATALFPKRDDEVEAAEEIMEINPFTLEELN